MVLVTTKRLVNIRRNDTRSTMESAKISKIVVKKVPYREPARMEEFWADKTVVIIFLRRFGCLFCRQSASAISTLLPFFEANDIRLVGIGLEELGVDEFVKGGYFGGELYVDSNKATYTALGYRRHNIWTIIMSLFSRRAWSAIAKGRAGRTKGNLKGNVFQNGGVLIVKKGGQEVLLSYRQENPADHVLNEDILNALKMGSKTHSKGGHYDSLLGKEF